MQDANISFNTYIHNPDTGEEGQITIRGVNAQKWGDLYDDVMVSLKERGFVPKNGLDWKKAKRTSFPNLKKSDDTFDCQYLIVKIDKGQRRYGVMGDKSKYPVNVYPEVLKAIGKDPAKYELDHQYPMDGWKARYEVGKKGYPSKVTSLEQIG